MKPYPFVSLNHFTVPRCLLISSQCSFPLSLQLSPVTCPLLLNFFQAQAHLRAYRPAAGREELFRHSYVFQHTALLPITPYSKQRRRRALARLILQSEQRLHLRCDGRAGVRVIEPDLRHCRLLRIAIEVGQRLGARCCVLVLPVCMPRGLYRGREELEDERSSAAQVDQVKLPNPLTDCRPC